MPINLLDRLNTSSVGKRKSPRLLITNEAKKAKNELHEVVVKNTDIPNVSLKNEKASDDTIQVRVSPKFFMKMVKSMTEEQVSWVKSTGFGGLLQFHIKDIHHKIGYKVVSSFDHADIKLHLPSGNIAIREEDVKEILGLPMGSTILTLKDKNIEVESLWRQQFHVSDGHKITANMVLDKLKENRDVDILFKLNFMIILTNAFIQCNGNAFVNQKILRFMGDIDNCSKYNWCELLIDSLLESTRIWKQDPKRKSYAGPLMFLIIFYVDRIVYKGKRSAKRTMPSWVGWKDSLLRQRSLEELQSNSFEKGVYSKGQWKEATDSKMKKKKVVRKYTQTTKGEDGDTSTFVEEVNIEKDCIYRLEASASRLIQAVSSYEAERSSCISILPSNTRLYETDTMILKIVTKLLDTIGKSTRETDRCDEERICSKKSPLSNHDAVLGKEGSNTTIVRDQSGDIIKEFPSFSLGLTQTTPNKTPLKNQATDEVIAGNIHAGFIANKSDYICIEEASKVEEVIKKMDFGEKTSNMVEIPAVKSDEAKDGGRGKIKREGKPSEIMRSPYLKRLLNIKKKQNQDERKIWDWVFKSDEPNDGIIFKWKYVLNTRADLLCMEEGNYIFYFIVETLILLLNHNEVGRAATSPYRFFIPIISMDIESVVIEEYDEFEKRMNTVWEMFPNVKILDLDMVFFPLIQDDTHFYIICYNLKKPAWELIDNMTSCQVGAAYYKSFPKDLIHQKKQLNRLRSLYLHEIVTSELNELSFINVDKSEEFNKLAADQKKAEVQMGGLIDNVDGLRTLRSRK